METFLSKRCRNWAKPLSSLEARFRILFVLKSCRDFFCSHFVGFYWVNKTELRKQRIGQATGGLDQHRFSVIDLNAPCLKICLCFPFRLCLKICVNTRHYGKPFLVICNATKHTFKKIKEVFPIWEFLQYICLKLIG